ncbi:hypothetical protein GCM10010916_13300 [Paenibacillus abyssi]|uniref:Uncharacterized protein n=1 Tax=Paenibacillus abyssi TaxID=1340531 RepID=A0A917CT39_9BACL|nr:hypothetical protein GCM10010916_13300 [Paenibacillus abyssi]
MLWCIVGTPFLLREVQKLERVFKPIIYVEQIAFLCKGELINRKLGDLLTLSG